MPANISIVNNTDSVSFVCAASGIPKPVIFWEKLVNEEVELLNGSNPMLSITTASHMTGSFIVVTSTLEITSVSVTYAESYKCTAQNYVGGTQIPSIDKTVFHLVIQSK